jgi:hypothetical protein
MDTNDWNGIGNLAGAVFYAVLDAIGPEASAVACDSLRKSGNDLSGWPELQRLIWHILDIVDPVPDDHSEHAQLMRASEADEHRSRFRLVEGGRRPDPAGNAFPNPSMEGPFLDAS